MKVWMRKVLTIFAYAVAALLLFFAAAVFAFYHMIQVGELRRYLVGEFEARSGLKLEIGASEVELGRVLGVSFNDFALKSADGGMTVVAAPKILIRVALLPLFQRRLVFYSVHLDRPRAEIVRDEHGKIPWIDLVSNLPLRRETDGFALDLRELIIDGGEILFADRSTGGEPVETRFQAMRLALHRLRGEGLREALKGFSSDIPSGPGLDFDFKTVVRRGERQADVAVEGRSFFADENLDAGRARVDAYISSTASPAAFLWEVAGRPAAETPPRGALSYRLHLQGTAERGARVSGEVHFTGLEADLPDLFPAAAALGNGRLDVVADWNPQLVRFERLDLHSNRLEFSARGSVAALQSPDPRVSLRVTTPFLPFTVARAFLPTRLLQSPRLEYLAAGFDRGEIRVASAELSGSFSDLRPFAQGGKDDSLAFTAELRNAGGEWAGERPLAFSAASGQLVFEKGTLYYKNFRATLGQSQLSELSGAQRRPFSGGPLELRVRGDADLAELREHLPPSLLPGSAAKTIDGLRDLAGRARIDLSLRADGAAPLEFSGVASLDGARFRVGNVALNQVKGDVNFSPAEISAARATATLNGSDLRLRFALKDLASGAGTFDVGIESRALKAADALGLLLPLDFSKSPGQVGVNLRITGSFAAPEARKVAGELELVGVQIPVPVFDDPFRDVNGKVRIAGANIDLEGMRGRIGGDAISLDGRWTGGEHPMLVFNLSAPDLDIRHILPHHVTPDDAWYEGLQVRGKFALAKAKYDNFVFTDLKTDLVLDHRTWSLERFSARAQGGTVEGSGAFRDRGEAGLFTIDPDIRGVPLQTVLGWFDIDNNDVSGAVRLTGKLEFRGKTGEEHRRTLNGALRVRVDDGLMRRFQLAVRILSFLDLSRWFTLRLPNINQEGIGFRSVSADVKIAQGIYFTQNFLLDGDDLRITGAGDLDGTKGDLDFVVAVRPFPGLDRAWNYIPVIGTGLAAVKNSLLVASFRVQGPINDASVTPAPLSTLSEFFYGALRIPKGLIGLPTTPSAPREPPAAEKEPAPSLPTGPAPAQ
jgi:uncharacterized protein involved in outer membrane biogenesis